jgi:hypothetical protein
MIILLEEKVIFLNIFLMVENEKLIFICYLNQNFVLVRTRTFFLNLNNQSLVKI